MHAVEETGRGVFEDKATRTCFACEHVVNNMRALRQLALSKKTINRFDHIAEPVVLSVVSLQQQTQHQQQSSNH